MEVQKLKFMLSIQQQIDTLVLKYGTKHPEIIELVSLFEKVSENELNKVNPKPNIESNELTLITNNTNVIREHLNIRGDSSINYSLIKNKVVRDQLNKDNLRMENFRFEISNRSESERFFNFCINAFYQIEQLVNYYYGSKYSNFISLCDHLNSLTYMDLNTKQTKRIFTLNNETSINDIVIAVKLNAFKTEFFNDHYLTIGKNIDALRHIRNRMEHRCGIVEIHDKKEKMILDFYEKNTFNSVVGLLIKIRDTIILNLI